MSEEETIKVMLASLKRCEPILKKMLPYVSGPSKAYVEGVYADVVAAMIAGKEALEREPVP